MSSGGSADAGIISSPLESTVVAQSSGPIDALGIDGATLYWVTSANGLWALGPASTAPRLLAQQAPPVGSECAPFHRLALTTRDVFWLERSSDSTSQLAGALHRAERDGSGDTLLATWMTSAPYPVVAADDTRVYWLEAKWGPADLGGVVRMLPVDAPPGTPPTTLVPGNDAYTISTLAVSGSMLYWVSIYNWTTMFHPQLYAEAVNDLLAPQPPSPIQLGESAWVYPHDGDLYVQLPRSSWQTDLGRRSADGSTVDLGPIDGADNIVFIDDWALVSVPPRSCGDNHHRLVAVPTVTAVDRAVVQLADNLGAPAVLGTELAFVDLMGQVHTSTLDQVRAALVAPR